MVVYSILTTFRAVQIVRVDRAYVPSNNDPQSNSAPSIVVDAQVTITDGTNTFACHDTVLPRSDSSRYHTGVQAYVGWFRAMKGVNYTLSVVSPTAGMVTASTTVLSSPSLTTDDFMASFVRNPWFSYATHGIKGSLTAAQGTAACAVRFYVHYSQYDYAVISENRMEIPILMKRVVTPFAHLFFPTYPSISQNISSGNVFNFDSYAYQAAIYNNTRGHINVSYERAVFYFYQFDNAAWKYYEITNQFADRSSVRADKPDFSNIAGGLGVFGSMTVDSLEFPLTQWLPPPSGWEP